MDLVNNFLALFMEAAPWLLLGLLIAGLIKSFVPTEQLSKHMGGNDLKSVVKAAFIGAPLPLCSCGVLPAAIGLRRSGASKSATVSFLVATPETGVDSVSVSYALLGPFMAIVRPIAAIISAITAGLLVGKGQEAEEKLEAKQQEQSSTSCCSSKTKQAVFTPVQPSEKPAIESSSACCSSKKAEPALTQAGSSCCSSNNANTAAKEASSCCASKSRAQATGIKDKLLQGLAFSSYDLIKDTMLWLLIGLFFAALVHTFLPADFLAQYGHGVIAMLLMVLVGIPMYICATASTPIAAGLMMAGISPGAALVFMLAGPATNIAALGLVLKELGRRALAAYLTGVIGSALVIGSLVDFIAESYAINPAVQLAEHGLLPHWLMLSCSLLLAFLMLRAVYLRYIKK